jgi:hypothetical protein
MWNVRFFAGNTRDMKIHTFEYKHVSVATRMRWEGHAARMGERGMHIAYWWESQKERDHWNDRVVGGWTILGRILDRMGWCGLDRCGSRWGPAEGSCEHGNASSGSIKCWEILEWLHNWRLLKNGSAPWVSEVWPQLALLSYFTFEFNVLSVIKAFRSDEQLQRRRLSGYERSQRISFSRGHARNGPMLKNKGVV